MRLTSARWMIAALVALTLGTGCADLSGVQHFAATSAQAADYTKLVDAYVESPGLQKRFAPESVDGLGAIGEFVEFDEQSEARQKQRGGLLALHEGVEEYMLALASLAANEAVEFGADFEELSTALGDAGFDSAAGDAVETLGSLVARAASDGYRRRQVREVIREGNEPLQSIVSSLAEIVGGISAEAQLLRDMAARYYESRIREAVERDETGVEAILESWAYRERSEIEALATAARDYSRALDQIAVAHQELFDKLDEIDSDEVQRQMKFHAREIRGAMKTLRAL